LEEYHSEGQQMTSRKMDRATLVRLRQLLDTAIESDTPEAHSTLAASLAEMLKKSGGDETAFALEAIEEVWSKGCMPPFPLSVSPENEARLCRLLSDMLAVQSFALAISTGDLSQPFEARGVMAGSFKAVQSSLRHLTWQTGMIARGDFSQRVDFMGEFSESFNSMVRNLSEAHDRVKRYTEELQQVNTDLRAEIAEREQAEKALRVNREWLRVTLNSIGDAVMTADTQGRITFLNPVAVALTGWELEEAAGQPVQEVFRIINEKTGKPAENIVHRVLQEGKIALLANNTALISREGRAIPIEDSAAPIMNNEGDLLGVVLIFRDVTEKRQAHEAVIRSKEEWERTFRSIPDLIAVLDDKHKVMRANPAMAQKLGLAPEECVGLPCHKVVHGMDEPPEFCPHVHTLRDASEHCAEVYNERLGGHFVISTTPVFNDEGRTIGSVHVARDITERKRMEDELRRSRDELELRVRERTAELSATIAKLKLINQELEEFVFVASHDLQEPLRKIQTFCDLTQKSCSSELDDVGKQYLERVINSATRMRQLLGDLLQFANVTTKPKSFKAIDLAKIVLEAAKLFEEKIKEAGGVVEIRDLPEIEADESQLLQLFQNLIGNALKFRNEESPRIKVTAKLDGLEICEIGVEDNGIGFEQQFAERIFKPFQRLHNRAKYEGTGMGLAICRKIIERHGGSIRVESKPGKGSRFIVRLPVNHKLMGV
jgi:PAS domain S-box-containing protein